MKKVLPLVALAGIVAPTFAVSAAETAITTAQTEITSIVTLAGGGLIAIALAGVGFKVGASWIRKLGGSAR